MIRQLYEGGMGIEQIAGFAGLTPDEVRLICQA